MEFDPYSHEYYADSTEIFRWLREEAPLYYSEKYGFWAVSRYEDVLKGYSDWHRLSSSRGVGFGGVNRDESVAGNILSLDPPSHDRLRKLVSRAFTPRAAKVYESIVRQVVTASLDPLDGADHFDVIVDIAERFPVEIISTLLGVPKEDRRNVQQWTAARLSANPTDPDTMEASTWGTNELFEYFAALVVDRRKHLGDDLISRLCEVGTEPDSEEQPLSDEEIVTFVRLLGSAGSETVTKLVGNGVVLFHRYRDQWQKVLDDRSLIPGAIEEILRFWPPVQYSGRWVLEDFEFSAGEVKADERVLLVTGAATRDPRRFERPDEFDIERNQYLQLGFGFGIHTCLGAHLARQEGRVFFEEVRRRWPNLEVDEDGLKKVEMVNVAGYANVPVTIPSAAIAS